MERLSIFARGWQRKSLLMLDVAGCPRWLARWRCRMTRQENEAYAALSAYIMATTPEVDDDDDN